MNTTTEPIADNNLFEPSSDDTDVPRKSHDEKSVFKSGHYCCVVNCHKRTGRDKVSFFHVNRANKTQTDMWCQAIRRENPDGSLWRPSPHSKICGAHFIKGKPSRDVNDPDYVPSKLGHLKPKTEQDIARHERVRLMSSLVK